MGSEYVKWIREIDIVVKDKKVVQNEEVVNNLINILRNNSIEVIKTYSDFTCEKLLNRVTLETKDGFLFNLFLTNEDPYVFIKSHFDRGFYRGKFYDQVVKDNDSSQPDPLIEKLFPHLCLNWKNEDDQLFFSKITNLGIIAGGSILHCLIEEIPIGDIDIFTFEKVRYNIIIGLICDRLEKSKVEIKNKDESPYLNYEITTITNDGIIAIQVILKEDINTLDELMEGFDLDYVRCSYHKGKIAITDEAKIAHQTKIVTIEKNIAYSKERLDKIRKKGFRIMNKLPLYSDDLPMTSNNLEYTFYLTKMLNILNIFNIKQSYRESLYFNPKKHCKSFVDIDIDYTHIILQCNPLDCGDLNLLLADFCNGNERKYLEDRWTSDEGVKRKEVLIDGLKKYHKLLKPYSHDNDVLFETGCQDCIRKRNVRRKTLIYKFLDYMSCFAELFNFNSIYFGVDVKFHLLQLKEIDNEIMKYYLKLIFL